MAKPEKVSVTPTLPQQWDGDRASYHATLLFRLLSIRTQTAIVICAVVLACAWIVASLCGVLAAYFSH